MAERKVDRRLANNAYSYPFYYNEQKKILLSNTSTSVVNGNKVYTSTTVLKTFSLALVKTREEYRFFEGSGGSRLAVTLL